MERWNNSDILYVLYDENNFIGCVAIDRKNFFPFISQLLISKKYRKMGYGKYLLEIGEKYSQMLGFYESKLWCDENLLDYYKNSGWKKENEIIKDGNKKLIMTKNIKL